MTQREWFVLLFCAVTAMSAVRLLGNITEPLDQQRIQAPVVSTP